MAHFFGTLRNLSRPAIVTRLGHKTAGVHTSVQSWEHVFSMMAYHKNGMDYLRISYAPKGASHIITLLDEPMSTLAVDWADRHRIVLTKHVYRDIPPSPEFQPKTNPSTCRECGYPLVLKSEDINGDHANEPEIYEDDNGGLCGSCHCGSRHGK